MRAQRIDAGIDLLAGETIVLQGPPERTRATIGCVLVEAQMRTLVITFETLVDISALVVVIVSAKSSRTHGIFACETVLDELHISRTSALITTRNINALVRTIVLLFETLVNIRASRSIIQ